jgi:acylphosphatase
MSHHGGMSKAVEVWITGQVVGVSFRAFAQAQARAQGVAGWVRNEPDGSVAAHFEGPEDAVDAMVAWCHNGPAYAEVEHVEVAEVDQSGVTGFEIRFD